MIPFLLLTSLHTRPRLGCPGKSCSFPGGLCKLSPREVWESSCFLEHPSTGSVCWGLVPPARAAPPRPGAPRLLPLCPVAMGTSLPQLTVPFPFILLGACFCFHFLCSQPPLLWGSPSGGQGRLLGMKVAITDPRTLRCRPVLCSPRRGEPASSTPCRHVLSKARPCPTCGQSPSSFMAENPRETQGMCLRGQQSVRGVFVGLRPTGSLTPLPQGKVAVGHLDSQL